MSNRPLELNHVRIENREIENERMEFNPGRVFELGPNLTFRKCTLILRLRPGELVLQGPRFIDCTIEVKRRQKAVPWYAAYLKGCTLKGPFEDCDFGRWTHSPYRAWGGVEDCDFSKARLDACTFTGCDPSTLQFPSWPYFTIVSPTKRKLKQMSKLPWPGETGVLVHMLANGPKNLAAMTMWARRFARRWSASPQRLKAVLAQVEGVRY